jgi:hypothetical protein
MRTLQILSPLFTDHYLTSDDTAPSPNDSVLVTLPQLASTIFDFLTNCCRGGKAKAWFNDEANINLSIQSIFFWAQITRSDVGTLG